jgi:hypothetical protein
MTIVASGSVSTFFMEVLEDALRECRVDATGGTTQYLVGLLADYAHPDPLAGEAMNRPVAFLLEEALRTPEPAARFERLRALGDGVLYACGFFSDHFEARGVAQDYLFGIGTRAYGAASSMLHAPGESSGPEAPPFDVFRELAGKFGSFVEVLSDVADSTIAMGAGTPKNLLKVYERWLRTGSDRLASALVAQGLVPTRGPKGVVQ